MLVSLLFHLNRLSSAAASAAGRDRKWSTHSLEKETRDRIKVLKMGLGDSRPLGQEPCCLELHHFHLASWQAESICCVTLKSASCVPGHVSHFIDYFKLSLLVSCTRGCHLAGGHRPAYALGEHLGVYTSNVLNLH